MPRAANGAEFHDERISTGRSLGDLPPFGGLVDTIGMAAITARGLHVPATSARHLGLIGETQSIKRTSLVRSSGAAWRRNDHKKRSNERSGICR
jgi:hypothetical protein